MKAWAGFDDGADRVDISLNDGMMSGAGGAPMEAQSEARRITRTVEWEASVVCNEGQAEQTCHI